MRTYSAKTSCVFRYTRERWGEFSNFANLPEPIVVNDIRFSTSEHLYQALKHATDSEAITRIAAAPSAYLAKRTATSIILPDPRAWNTHRINAMRWTLRIKRESNRELIDRILDDTGDRPIVEASARDDYWGAKPSRDGTHLGKNILGRLWMEVRQDTSTNAPSAAASYWHTRLHATWPLGILAPACP